MPTDRAHTRRDAALWRPPTLAPRHTRADTSCLDAEAGGVRGARRIWAEAHQASGTCGGGAPAARLYGIAVLLAMLLGGTVSAQSAPAEWASDPVWGQVFPDSASTRASLKGVDLRDTTTTVARVPTQSERDLQRAVLTLHMAMPGTPHAGDAESDPSGRAHALRQSDVVLRRGDLSVVSASGRAVAFERMLDGHRRLVAINAGDQAAFLELPDDGVPQPWTPMFVSRDDAGRIPSLLIYLDDAPSAPGGSRATYGLQIPPRTTVIYRPAEPADVRPRGLDE